MPIIDVMVLEGTTTQEQREEFMKNVTDSAVNDLGAPQQAVRILIHEEPKTHYSVGGVPKSKG